MTFELRRTPLPWEGASFATFAIAGRGFPKMNAVMKRYSSWHLLTAVTLVILLWASAAKAKDFEGRVVGVHDGDTLTVLHGLNSNKSVKVRLAGIDAPEMGQAFGANAKRALSDLVFGKTVQVMDHGHDDYGRTIADVTVDRVWVNLAMVGQGLAWRYAQYSKDPKLNAAEIHARAEKLGLWQDKRPEPPWDWRHHKDRRK